jgi:hypothetical protein
MEHIVMGTTKPQNKNIFYGDIVIWFPKGKNEHIGKKFKTMV